MDILKPVISDTIKRAVTYASNNDFALIIGCDSNTHSFLYGNDSNKRGEDLEEFITQSGLRGENIGSTPTFQTSRASSCIDVTLTKGVPGRLNNWRVNTDYNGSDHHTILFSTTRRFETLPGTRPWSRANWQLFTAELSKAKFYFPDSVTDKKIDRLS